MLGTDHRYHKMLGYLLIAAEVARTFVPALNLLVRAIDRFTGHANQAGVEAGVEAGGDTPMGNELL